MADLALLSADTASASISHQYRPFEETIEAPPYQRQDALPSELDLGDPRSIESLHAIDAVWPQISSAKKAEWLRNLQIVLPIKSNHAGDIALLPGGVIAVRHSDGVLVCDPLETVTLNDVDASELRRAVSSKWRAATLLHVEDGVVLVPGIPELLPPQSATIVSEATRLPGRAATTGPALIQWFVSGATVRPLVPAPTSVALAASVAGVRVSEDLAAVLPEFWDADDDHARMYLISSSLIHYVSDLLPETLSEELRFSITDLCVSGQNSIAGRLSELLAAVPACFLGDENTAFGEPPASWTNGIAMMRCAPRPLALFGFEASLEPRYAILALRNVIGDNPAVIFHETGTSQRGVSAALESDAALFVARWATENGRIGVLLDPRVSPLGLYSLAASLAHATDGAVVVAAPCWGFCHRIGRDHEAGNAAWFGMGAGLDELDLLLSSAVGIH